LQLGGVVNPNHNKNIADKGVFFRQLFPHLPAKIVTFSEKIGPKSAKKTTKKLFSRRPSQHKNHRLAALIGPGMGLTSRIGGIFSATFSSPSGENCHFLGNIFAQLCS